MPDIVTDLDKLTPEELASVARLINKFASRHEDTKAKQSNVKKKKIKNVDKPRKRKHTKPKDEVLEVQHGVGRKEPRRRILVDENDNIDVRRSGVGRTVPRSRQNDDNLHRRRSGRVACRTEEVRLTGENKFLSMKVRGGKKLIDEEKKDVKIDRLLWGNNVPAERPETFEYAEVRCKGCGLYFDVNPALILIDEETGKPNFTCNDCSPRERKFEEE